MRLHFLTLASGERNSTVASRWCPRITLLMVLSIPGLILGMASWAFAVPVTVTISKIEGDKLEADGRLDPDWYAGVTINGVTFDTHALRAANADGLSDKQLIEPFWHFTVDVPAAQGTAPVVIQVWESDGCLEAFCSSCDAGSGNICGLCKSSDCSEDDHADLNPDPNLMDVGISVDLATGRWTGTTRANCSTGDDPDATTLVCWDVSVLSESGDADGDGLLDGWEQNGFDANGADVPTDLPLHSWGADPLHKDIFVELDWDPQREISPWTISGLKDAFAAAPIDAGVERIPNPDGRPGITLHIDTGTMSYCDPPENCVNNPHCCVGDNLGGGTVIPPFSGCLDASFYAAKKISEARRQIFRYGILGKKVSDDCGSGQAEMGGNDFVVRTEYGGADSGSLMHEIGHTLNLSHVGDPDPALRTANCWPNYVSVMNYDNPFIVQSTESNPQGAIIDFSPPRYPGGRSLAPLPTLHENALDETLVLDPNDHTNFFTFVNAQGRKVLSRLDKPINWNGDTDPPFEASLPPMNIDTQGNGNASVRACLNDTTNSTLTGYDDWHNIRFKFREFGESVNGPINPTPYREPTIEERQELLQVLNTTDLAIVKTAGPDPVRAGADLTYTITVVNRGPNPSFRTRVGDVLPTTVTFVGSTGECTEDPTGTATCDLGEILAGESREFALTVRPDPNALFEAAGPLVITNRANTVNLAGPDLDMSNNGASVESEIAPGLMNVVDVRLVPSRLAGQAEGRITIKGDFIAPSAVNLASGFSLRVLDALGLDQLQTWTAGECVTVSARSMRCDTPHHRAAVRMKSFAQAPTLFRFVVKLRKRVMLAPFQAPVRVLLLDANSVRSDEIAECGVTHDAGVRCRRL